MLWWLHRSKHKNHQKLSLWVTYKLCRRCAHNGGKVFLFYVCFCDLVGANRSFMFKTRRKFSADFIIFYNAVAVLGHPVGSGNEISAATFADAIFSLVDKNIISKKV